MVAASGEQEQKQQTSVTTAEEEALKRNTDCVYFLASPLTCKKGSECEYRHSEYARVNPRDCYFWLNGSCLNPKCGFRHPPLDGLLGNQEGAPAGSSVHSSHATAVLSASALHAPYNMKQAVPCVFFQKGGCLKGDKCAFLHISNPATSKTQQPSNATPAMEPHSLRHPSGNQEKNLAANVSKVGVCVEAPRAVAKLQNAFGSGRGNEKNVSQNLGFEFALQKNATVSEGGTLGCPNQLLQTHGSEDNNSFQNSKEHEDFLRESSPGFDVLVDSEHRDSNYYLHEDQYATRGQDGRNSVNEYDADFNSNDDEGVFPDLQGYESYDQMQERQYGWGQHRASSERVLERRAYSKDESPDHTGESDLRYRLSKQRRVDNGFRSAVTHDHVGKYSEERNLYRSRIDTRNQSSLSSSRLQGRIKLPGRVNGSDYHLEKGMERGGNRRHISYPGRLRDRIKGRNEDNYGEDRNFRASRMTREMSDERSTEFSAPKSLAELKGGKDDSSSEPSLRKRKSLDHHQQSEGDLAFEGPLPLSEILKRKRAAATSGSRMSSSVKKEEYHQETKENEVSTISKHETDKDQSKSATEEKTETGQDHSSEPTRMNEAETEEAAVVDEGMDVTEYEGDDQNGEYYEEGYEEDGEYYEEGENAEGEEEYVEEEEEDGNDLAKKIGVTFS